METVPLLTKKDFDPEKNLVPKNGQSPFYKKLLKKTITNCNTKWFKTSWIGILAYVSICCFYDSYIITVDLIYKLKTLSISHIYSI